MLCSPKQVRIWHFNHPDPIRQAVAATAHLVAATTVVAAPPVAAPAAQDLQLVADRVLPAHALPVHARKDRAHLSPVANKHRNTVSTTLFVCQRCASWATIWPKSAKWLAKR